MATGRAMQLTRQIGEHLVAAKLGRMGYVATPVAGNVPPSRQFQADTFLDIEISGGTQLVRGEQVLPNPDLLCVFVVIKTDERDEF
jgi:hypothetical protein